jgi:hypothetical protein
MTIGPLQPTVLPARCKGCALRSEPRPQGAPPAGWTRVGGFYFCGRCASERGLRLGLRS